MKKGFIKNLTSIFRRYENKFLSLNKRFIVPDEKSDAFYDLSDRFYEREGVCEHLKHPIELLKMSYANEDHITNAIGFWKVKSNLKLLFKWMAIIKNTKMHMKNYANKWNLTQTLQETTKMQAVIIKEQRANVMKSLPK